MKPYRTREVALVLTHRMSPVYAVQPVGPVRWSISKRSNPVFTAEKPDVECHSAAGPGQPEEGQTATVGASTGTPGAVL